MRKFTRLSILSLLVFAVSSLMVYALPSSVLRVTKMFSYIFFTLKSTTVFPVFLKFCFFMMLFGLMYNGGLQAFKSQGDKSPMKRALSIIAFIIALISAIFVPYTVLLYIFRLYSAILAILFALLPVIVGFFMNQYLFNKDTRTDHILRAILYFVIAGIIFGVIGNVEANSSPETQIYRDITDWLMIGAVFAFVAAIFNLVLAFGGGAAEGAGTVRSWFGGERPAVPPVAPPGPAPPVAPNPAVITDLTNRMGQFINHVNNPPNGAVVLSHELSNQFLQDVEAIISPTPLPSPLSIPALHAAAGGNLGLVQTRAQDFMTTQLGPALGILGSVRTEMEAIYTLATTSGQYNNVAEGVRQQFEAAVTAFLVAETQLTELAGFIGAL